MSLLFSSSSSTTTPNSNGAALLPSPLQELVVSIVQTIYAVVIATTLLAQSWTRSVESALCSQIKRRKKLQKLEFLTCWVLILLLSEGLVARVMNCFQHDEEDFKQLSSFSSYVHSSATQYIRMSIFTRVLAYAVDFANAREKLGKLPSWLVLHHGGVTAFHTLVSCYFSRSYSKSLLYLVALQSSHNTWTKKYSLALYWGNVFLGVFTSCSFSLMNAMEDEVSLSLVPCICSLVALFTTLAGVSILFVESLRCNHNKHEKKHN